MKYEYKCPECRGEFNYDGIRKATIDGRAMCPFCGNVMKGVTVNL